MVRGDGRRLDVAHAATAGGEEDEVLGEDGGAVVPAAATAEKDGEDEDDEESDIEIPPKRRVRLLSFRWHTRSLLSN